MADSKNFPLKHVIWAIDPFISDFGPQLRAGEVLKALLGKQSCEIEPVAIVLKDQIPYLSLTLRSERDIKLKLSEIIRTRLSDCGLSGLQTLTVRTESDFSVKSGVRNLVEYAAGKSADLILLTTHAKPRSIGQGGLGTFSDSLFLQCGIPMLLVPPKRKAPDYFDHVVFATDFSESSKGSLPRVISLAAAIGARITVFHKLQPPLVDFTAADLAEFDRWKAEKKKARVEELEELVHLASQEGVQSELCLEEDRQTSPSAALLTYTKDLEHAFIAMTPHDNPEFPFPGSVTRQVMRALECPAWIIPPVFLP